MVRGARPSHPCPVAITDVHYRAEIGTAACVVVVDGYVDLGEHGTPGLGAHLFRALLRHVDRLARRLAQPVR